MYSPSHNFHTVVRLGAELPISGNYSSADHRKYFFQILKDLYQKYVPNSSHHIFLCLGGLMTSYDIRTYRAMKFVPNDLDVIMVLEVRTTINFLVSLDIFIPTLNWN